MKKFEVRSFGPIDEGSVTFGDITLLVGPQGSGKSIFLQLLKYTEDLSYIKSTLNRYGYNWQLDKTQLLERYFGEGMSTLLGDKTEIKKDGSVISLDSTKSPKKSSTQKEKVFYIPAQRILCLDNGWPRNFQSFDSGIPFVLRNFSETLRLLMEEGRNDVFPVKNRLNATLRDSIQDNIYYSGNIVLEKKNKYRMLMKLKKGDIPFMSWSAGQKEFLSLLLSLYWLCPPSKKSKQANIKYVVIEEPEMGLHPDAIRSILLLCIELISRGYKVLISTHSPVFLEFAWALRILKENKGNFENVNRLFSDKKLNSFQEIFDALLKKKSINTFFFRMHDGKATIEDISTLDPGADKDYIVNWGGLTAFADKVTDAISDTFSNSEDER